MLSGDLTKQSLSITMYGEKQWGDNGRQQMSPEGMLLLALESILQCSPAEVFNMFPSADP